MRSTDVGVAHHSSRNSWWAQALQNRLIALVLVMVVVVPLIATPAYYIVGSAPAIVFQGFAILLATSLIWRARWDFAPRWLPTF
jgi:hypothetical protein